jgi:hypothetical protein
MIENNLANSESDEEDSSNEEEDTDEGNNGTDLSPEADNKAQSTGESTPVPLTTIAKFKEGSTLEEHFVTMDSTTKTFEIRHSLFTRITKDKEEGMTPPEKLNIRTRTMTEKIQTEISKSFENNKPDELEEYAKYHLTEEGGPT